MISAALTVLTLLCAALLALWFYSTVEDNRRGNVGLAVGAWLLFTAWLASSGFLSQWDALPPRAPLVPITALLLVLGLSRTKLSEEWLAATPRHWPVAFQTFRIGVELAFYGLFLSGRAPVQVTFEGRNFDILVGLTAPLMALAIVKMDLGPRAVIVWNVAGLLILGNTIGTVLTSLPGPLHLNWPGQPFVEFTTWPVIWIPAFLAPLAIFLHGSSIRQNLTAHLGGGRFFSKL